MSFGSNGGAGNQGVTLSGTYSATTATNFGDVAGPCVHGTTVLFTGPVTQVGSLTLAFSTADFGPATPVTLTVPTLNVAYGTLTGTDSFTATGPFNFTEATVSGSGTIDAYGGIPAPFGAIALDGVTLNNYATATLTRDGIGFAHGAVFNNEANAIFDDQTDGTIGAVGAAGTFNNAGTFTKSAGTGVTAVGVPFNNTGTASVSSGTLAFQGGGTSTGPYTGATGTTLDFEGLQSLAGAVSGNTVSFGSNGGAGNQGVTLSGTYSATTATNFGDVAGPFVHGTTVLFTGPVTQVGSLTLAFSTADFGPATPVTLTVPTLNVAYGTLTGTDSFTATGPFNFTEATVSGSGTINAYGGIPAPLAPSRSMA